MKVAPNGYNDYYNGYEFLTFGSQAEVKSFRNWLDEFGVKYNYIESTTFCDRLFIRDKESMMFIKLTWINNGCEDYYRELLR